MDIENRELFSLIDLIYACGTGERSWEDFLAAYEARNPALKTAIVGYDAIGDALNLSISGGFDPDFFESYRSYYSKINPWVPLLQSVVEPPGVTWAHEHLPQYELEKTEFYNDWVKPQDDIASGFAVNLIKDKSCFINLACNVSFKHGAEAENAAADMRILGPHMQRAFHLYRHLDGQRVQTNAMEQVLDRLEAAIFIIGDGYTLHFANREGEALLRCGTIVGGDGAGHLVFLDPIDRKKIEGQIFHLNGKASRASTTVKLRPDPSGKSLIALVASLPRDVETGQFNRNKSNGTPHDPRLLIMLLDPVREWSARGSIITSAFGVTQAEARLAIGLMQGKSLRECSTAFGITYNTVRTQLQSLCAKTGVKKQTELILVLSRLFQIAGS